MTKAEALELIKEAKSLGLKSIEIDGLKVEFNSSEIPIIKEDINDEELVAPMSKYDQLTDEEILFWSSGYGYELEKEKLKEIEDNKRKLNKE